MALSFTNWRHKRSEHRGRFKIGLFLGLCFWVCGGCGAATARPTLAPFVPPTAPPTPASFGGVPDAATIAPIVRVTPLIGGSGPTATPAVASLPEDAENQNQQGDVAPDKIDPAALAKLAGSPGPDNGASPTLKGGGNGRTPPTPTLNVSPNQAKIESLRSSKVSFLSAYRQALGRAQQVLPDLQLVFASANVLKPERTVWSFLFLSSDGSRMWKVIFDSTGPKLDLTEQAPSMQTDALRIDMEKVLDTDELLRRAESAGLKLSWPVDVFNFQLEGTIRQPCFILTNVIQGKQVAINAYNGSIVRDDFTK